jgi:catechol 2,3-dioxygenase-like lactoylglutathione lyase family enzyme
MPGFHHVHIKGPDPKKTAQWYIDNFGGKLLREFDIRGAKSYDVEIGGVHLFITGLAPGEKLPPGSAERHLGLEHIGVQVEDVEGVVARLKQKGTRVLEPPVKTPTGAVVSFVEAPDNVRVELFQAP